MTGIEVDPSKIEAVNQGRSPIYEPGLEDMIRSNKERLRATANYLDAIAKSSVTFVVVPTPSDRHGAFSLRFVTPAMEKIGRALSKKNSYHLVVLTSTVMPGSMDGAVKPILEKNSRKRCGEGFGLCYSPEFIALGNVIKGLMNPDFVLVGESDAPAGGKLARIQQQICTNSPPVERMNFLSAELAKISLNSFVTMKMSFANTLAEICEKLPGADVDRVTSAIGRDRRVGGAYLKGAIGYGGPCFPRDNIAFARLAESVGAQASLAKSTHEVNLGQVERILGLLKKAGVSRGDTVAVLGLSYKPDTNIIDESQSVMLAKRLSEDGMNVRVYDPAAMQNAHAVLDSSVSYDDSAAESVKKSDACVVATPWPEFETINPRFLKGKVVLDCWRLLYSKRTYAKRYLAIGLGEGGHN